MTNYSKDQIQAEAGAIIYENERCSVDISMGVGKTRIAIMNMHRLFNDLAHYLIVVPKNSVIDTYKKEIKEVGLDYLLDHIEFVNYKSLEKKDRNNYSKVYLDEIHNIGPKHFDWLKKFEGGVLGLTGTRPPEYSIKSKMIELQCPFVYKFSVIEAVDNGLLNDYRIYIHMIPLSKSNDYVIKFKNGGRKVTSESSDYAQLCYKIDNSVGQQQFQNRLQRMRSMMSYPSKEIYAKNLIKEISKKCLIFANTHEQAKLLCKDNYISSNPKSAENLQNFNSGKISKLSSVLQLSEGINIPNLESCIILHAYSNNNKTGQRLSRILRLSPDKVADVHILCYENTIDELWVNSSLADFHQSKVQIIRKTY